MIMRVIVMNEALTPTQWLQCTQITQMNNTSSPTTAVLIGSVRHAVIKAHPYQVGVLVKVVEKLNRESSTTFNRQYCPFLSPGEASIVNLYNCIWSYLKFQIL